jgi:hypothetical protein
MILRPSCFCRSSTCLGSVLPTPDRDSKTREAGEWGQKNQLWVQSFILHHSPHPALELRPLRRNLRQRDAMGQRQLDWWTPQCGRQASRPDVPVVRSCGHVHSFPHRESYRTPCPSPLKHLNNTPGYTRKPYRRGLGRCAVGICAAQAAGPFVLHVRLGWWSASRRNESAAQCRRCRRRGARR